LKSAPRLRPQKETRDSLQQQWLRKVEPMVSTLRETGAALGYSHTHIALWRTGANILTQAEIDTLTDFVQRKVRFLLDQLCGAIPGAAAEAVSTGGAKERGV
jgi:hypothetical protein